MTTLQPCKFTFDDEAIYDGFAHGSTWNGFDNVAVSKATLDRLIAEAIDPESKEQFTEIEPMADGLYSLGWGFATQILHDDFADVLKVLADNDGACLYWQMPDVARAELALAACAILSDGDLLVHPDATVIEAGMAYTMKPEPKNLLAVALLEPDLNDALLPVMTALGITEGDVAAQHFSGYEPDAETVWREGNAMTRRDMLADYLRIELVWAVG